MKNKFSVGWVAAALLLAFFVPSAAIAVEYGGIGGRPANPDPAVPRSDTIFIYSLAPGATKDDGVRVVNNTDQAKTLMVYSVDSLIASGGAFSCEQLADTKDTVGSWIQLAQSEVSLAPKTNAVVPFTIRVPAATGPGEHNGCIVIQAKEAPIQGGQGVALSTRSALRVAITVPGEIKRSISFTDYRVSREKNGDFVLHTKQRNDGNVSVEADIKTTTKYFFGVQLATNGGKFGVLPGSESELNFELKRPFWGLLYKSQPTATYDDNGQTRTIEGKTVWFWAWPAPLAAAIELGVLAILIGGIWLLRRHRRRKRQSEIDPPRSSED